MEIRDVVEAKEQESCASELEQCSTLEDLSAEFLRQHRTTQHATDRSAEGNGDVSECGLAGGVVLPDLQEQGDDQVDAGEPSKEQKESANTGGVRAVVED